MQSKIIAGFLLLLISLFFYFSRLPVESVREEAQRLRDHTTSTANIHAALPDFTKIQDVHERKQQFFDFLLPLTQHANGELLKARSRILILQTSIDQGPLSVEDALWLGLIAEHYRVSLEHGFTRDFFRRLLRRVDIVPPSLVLAQAASESAWGTSRFAREGNNLFGEWCFSKGCGMIPQRRNSGARHEVTRFSSPYESLLSYMNNLNRHESYLTLRKYREQARSENASVTGQLLADGLSRYSERGRAYVREIKSVISHNQLTQYDDRMVASIVAPTP